MRPEYFDVCIVGAGPAGSTTAFFLIELAKRQNWKKIPSVGLMEKQEFPRDKFCGDAWCAPALDILEEMNILQQLQAKGLVRLLFY